MYHAQEACPDLQLLTEVKIGMLHQLRFRTRVNYSTVRNRSLAVSCITKKATHAPPKSFLRASKSYSKPCQAVRKHSETSKVIPQSFSEALALPEVAYRSSLARIVQAELRAR